MQSAFQRLLFIINPGSGAKSINWKKEIESFFGDKPQTISFYELEKDCSPASIRTIIEQQMPDLVVAAGGDGTVKLVAESLLGKNIAMAILPGGSANGMARELSIPDKPGDALQVLADGEVKQIHVLRVNNEICIHLSDVGFNAYVVKRFEENNTRGKWGYLKAAWKALWSHGYMDVTIKADNDFVTHKAAMVVLANATMYGNGVTINPEGTLEDELFELVIIKKISLSEIFKMRFTEWELNKKKTQVLQTSAAEIKSSHRLHFQVDGEYRGRVHHVKAEVLPHAISIVVPAAPNQTA
jgi:YegS/Rv2252/BmrU family lipid kinase